MISFFVVWKLSTLKPWSIHLSFLDFTYLYFIFILSYVLRIYLRVLYLFHVLLVPLCLLTFALYVLLFSLPGVFENRSLFQYNFFFLIIIYYQNKCMLLFVFWLETYLAW